MFSRRRLFSLLPLGALGAVVPAAKAEPEPPVAPEPSAWVELTCQRQPIYEWHTVRPPSISEKQWDLLGSGLQHMMGAKVQGDLVVPACGQKLKALRVPITPICPKCGWRQDISRDGVRELFMGIPC
jgi:hypothetical protein